MIRQQNETKPFAYMLRDILYMTAVDPFQIVRRLSFCKDTCRQTNTCYNVSTISNQQILRHRDTYNKLFYGVINLVYVICISSVYFHFPYT